MSDILFDLDGTLIDSAPGIARCVREALAEVSPDSASRVGSLRVGPPVREMIAALLPDADEVMLDCAVGVFRHRYDTDGWRDAIPYAGIDDTLRALRAEGHRLFVVTNKPQLPTGLIVVSLGWTGLFEVFVCRDSVSPPFPDKAAAVGHVLATTGADHASAILVGDTAEDALAAGRNGLRFACVSYGYGDADACAGAAATLASPDELLVWLRSSPS